MKHLPIINHTYQKLHNEFTRFITTKGYSRGKDVMYPTCIREFLFFIENKGVETIQNVDANTIQSYYYYISSRPNQRRAGGLSDSMLKTHLYSLRLFFDYLLDTDVLEYSPARLPKFTLKKSEQREILSNDQIRKLYTVCESYRDKALLSAAYGCGLRRSEMVNLDLEDVIFHKGIVIVRDSKNHKNRTIPMSDFVARHLKEYIVNERTKGLINNRKINNSFFVSNTGNRWRGNNMNDRLHYLVEKTNDLDIVNKKITLHSLRHSIATHLIDNGATIEFVQEFLGHSEIDTAHIYAKRRKQKLKIISQLR